jgi:hypothetical protein
MRRSAHDGKSANSTAAVDANIDLQSLVVRHHRRKTMELCLQGSGIGLRKWSRHPLTLATSGSFQEPTMADRQNFRPVPLAVGSLLGNNPDRLPHVCRANAEMTSR